jgi:hypothetical protein
VVRLASRPIGYLDQCQFAATHVEFYHRGSFMKQFWTGNWISANIASAGTRDGTRIEIHQFLRAKSSEHLTRFYHISTYLFVALVILVDFI